MCVCVCVFICECACEIDRQTDWLKIEQKVMLIQLQ